MLCFEKKKPVIGMVHLLPLPGSPDFDSMDKVVDRALKDAKKLVDGGIDGLIVENYGDRPFNEKVSKMTVASLSMVCHKIQDNVEVPIGINVLRNDWESALSISKALDLSFIRINVYTGYCLTELGPIKGEAGKISRFIENHEIDAHVFADIDVKHAEKIYPKSVKTDAIESSKRGEADALIVTGERTGAAVNTKELEEVKKIVDVPLFVGSGVNIKNVSKLLSRSDGVIIGTYLKEEGKTINPVSEKRVRKLIKKVRKEHR